MNVLLRIIALVFKELATVFKEPRARMTIIVPPLLQMFVFGYAASFDLHHARFAVWNQDRGPAAAELIADVRASSAFLYAGEVSGPEEVRRRVDRQKVVMVLEIPEDFQRNLTSRGHARVEAIVDGRNSNTAGTALIYLTSIIRAFNNQWRAAHHLPAAPVDAVARAWYNPEFESRWDIVPGLIGLLTLLQMILLTAMSVARAREQGTLDQLLVTPMGTLEIIIGKCAPTLLIGLGQATAALLVARFWFDIPFAGSYGVLYLGLGIFLLASIGVGLFVSTFTATMQQAMLGTFLFMVPFAILSGLTTPITSMPLLVQHITLMDPLRYAVTLIHEVYLQAYGLRGIWPQLWPLLIIAAVTLLWSSWAFWRKLN